MVGHTQSTLVGNLNSAILKDIHRHKCLRVIFWQMLYAAQIKSPNLNSKIQFFPIHIGNGVVVKKSWSPTGSISYTFKLLLKKHKSGT